MYLNKKIITSLILAANVNIVFAGNYIGGSFGQSSVDASGYNKPTAYKLFGGLRNKNFGIEAGYHNLGKFSIPTIFGDANTTVKGFEISGVGFLPLNEKFELFAKVGAFAWNVDSTVSSLNLSASDSGTDLTYGLGAEFKVMQDFSLRAEYQKFVKISDSDVSSISLGAAYRF